MFRSFQHQLNISMNPNDLVEQGNSFRSQWRYADSLACYAQAFVADPDCISAWNNYGNVMREMGYPERALPFLEHCLAMAPDHSVANFNRAVALLAMGDYDRGWSAYESRWNYEHLAGTLPDFPQPRWTGQDLRDKTVLLIGEQGLGDTIQFARYAIDLGQRGARLILAVPGGLKSLFSPTGCIVATVGFGEDLPPFDFWAPMMSVPGVLDVTLQNLRRDLSYIRPAQDLAAQWANRLGAKQRLRVGLCWSGRRDTWINQHKSMPFPVVLDMIRRAPQHDWINLQVDATPEEDQALDAAGVLRFPGTIASMADTAALIHNLDVVVSVDTAVAHLSGALGRPTWIMLNRYGCDWRWLTNREDCPWYPAARLFRQTEYNDWQSVTDRVIRHLDLFKI